MSDPPADAPNIHIRPAGDGDLGLIVSTWVGSHRMSARWLSRDDHDRLYRYAVKRALESCTVLVACHPEHRDHVYGWVCVDRDNPINAPLLHYAFVKSKFRRLGIARRLLGEAIGAYTYIAVGPTDKITRTKYIPTAWTRDGEHLATAGLTDGYRPDLFDPRHLVEKKA